MVVNSESLFVCLSEESLLYINWPIRRIPFEKHVDNVSPSDNAKKDFAITSVTKSIEISMYN